MQLVDGDKSARELPIPPDIGWVDDITDPNFGRRRLRAFVHTARDSRVAVTVDETGSDMHSATIDQNCPLWQRDFGRNLHNLAIAHEHVAVCECPLRTEGPDRCILYHDGSARRRLHSSELTEGKGKLISPKRFASLRFFRAVFLLLLVLLLVLGVVLLLVLRVVEGNACESERSPGTVGGFDEHRRAVTSACDGCSDLAIETEWAPIEDPGRAAIDDARALRSGASA